MRQEQFAIGELYHVYNRGVDKRNIVTSEKDSDRFVKSVCEFNTVDNVGSLKDLSKSAKLVNVHEESKETPLVNIICYCLNPNHFHLLLEEVQEHGISRFMKKLSGGYSRYFNIKNKRQGSLFQGSFKTKRVTNNAYLNHLSAYINLNHKVHNMSKKHLSLIRSSWREYTKGQTGLCKNTGIILDQFESQKEYKKFALTELEEMLAKRATYKELEEILLE